MKKLITITILLIAMSGCGNNQPSEQPSSRIHLIESSRIGGEGLYIVLVDGKEFIVSGFGGIYPIDKVISDTIATK